MYHFLYNSNGKKLLGFRNMHEKLEKLNFYIEIDWTYKIKKVKWVGKVLIKSILILTKKKDILLTLL